MKIKVTLGEISRKGNWEKACDLKGWDYYCLRERARPEDEVELTLEEAKEIGLL